MLKTVLIVMALASCLFVAHSAETATTTLDDWVGLYLIKTSDCTDKCSYGVGTILEITKNSADATKVDLKGTITKDAASKATITDNVCKYPTTETAQNVLDAPIEILKDGQCTPATPTCTVLGGSSAKTASVALKLDKTAKTFLIEYKQKTPRYAAENVAIDADAVADIACTITGSKLDAGAVTDINGTFNVSSSTCGDCVYTVGKELKITPDTSKTYLATLAGTLKDATKCTDLLQASMQCYYSGGKLYGCGGATIDGITAKRTEDSTIKKNYTLELSWKSGSTDCTTKGLDVTALTSSTTTTTSGFKAIAGFGMMFVLALMVLFK